MQEAAGEEEDADPTRSRPGRPTVNVKINLQKPYDAGAKILRLVRVRNFERVVIPCHIC